jgi:succinate-semialdehyde dehydrogenase/glutarate-semialdehyde dehydrogenase
MAIKSINPATGELVAEFAPINAASIEIALDAASGAFDRHRRSAFSERARLLTATAKQLSDHRDRWSRLLTQEMGKPLEQARAEVDKCAWVCRFYAEHGEPFLRDVEIESGAARSYVTHLPLGPVLAVMPWNFPFWQVFRFAAPALMAGNVVLLKHASNVPRAALALEEIFQEAGFGPGAFQTLLIEPKSVEAILTDRRVKAATVTGSVAAGSAVASIAGKCVKKTVLELGGSDAFIVMPSADLDQAVDAGVISRTINNGQSCIAAKRFIIHRDIYERFVERFVAGFEALRVGNPMDRDTDVGPLAMARSRTKLQDQIDDLVASGARRLVGAETREGPGNFLQPGVLTHVPATAATYYQELFGPVALVLEAESLDHALALANDSPYGLGSSIWTHDTEEAERAVRGIEAGATFVNELVKSDPRLPFGGIGSSGYGRELSRQGILEFVNQKTVFVA